MSALTRRAHKIALTLNKHQPKILFWAGVAGAVTTTVLASKATLKAQPVVNEHKRQRQTLERHLQTFSISDQEYRADLGKLYGDTTGKLVRLYTIPVVVGVASLAALTRSHQVLSNRNNALAAAFTSIDTAFKNYRARVVKKYGSEEDQKLLHGTTTKQVIGDDGKVREIEVLDPTTSKSPYVFLFDEKNRYWDKDPGYNQTWLENQQRYFDKKLKRDGFLFLNDVLDELGFPKTKAGQVVGWNYYKGADCYVNFGFDKSPDFVAGFERSVWLDFNCDGSIIDDIEE